MNCSTRHRTSEVDGVAVYGWPRRIGKRPKTVVPLVERAKFGAENPEAGRMDHYMAARWS